MDVITMYFNAGLIPMFMTMKNLGLTNRFLQLRLRKHKAQKSRGKHGAEGSNQSSGYGHNRRGGKTGQLQGVPVVLQVKQKDKGRKYYLKTDKPQINVTGESIL